MAKSVNRVIFIGRVGNNPELKDTEKTSVLTFNLAINESYKMNGQWRTTTEWIKLVCFGKLALAMQDKIAKGSSVYVEGKYKSGKYQDNEGNTRYSPYILISSILTFDAPDDTSGVKDAPANNDTPNDDIPF